MIEDNTRSQALSAAIKHIGIATYSSGKIFSYLVERGFPENISDSVVKELISRGYINDHKASRKVLISRTGKKQESREYIRKRLLAAGIDRYVAEDVVAGLPSDTRTCYMLYEAFGYSDDTDAIRTEMIGIAVRRGYPYELANSVYEVWSQELYR